MQLSAQLFLPQLVTFYSSYVLWLIVSKLLGPGQGKAATGASQLQSEEISIKDESEPRRVLLTPFTERVT